MSWPRSESLTTSAPRTAALLRRSTERTDSLRSWVELTELRAIPQAVPLAATKSAINEITSAGEGRRAGIRDRASRLTPLI